MKTLLLFILLSFITLSARENPFFRPERSQQILEENLSGKAVEVFLEEDRSTQLRTEKSIVSSERSIEITPPEILNYKYVRILLTQNKIRLETKDKLIKAFIAENPKVIILNFARRVDFATKKHTCMTAPFYEVRLGAHKRYYSVVVELKSSHNYSVEKYSYGYELIIKKEITE